ncbi:MAG: NYN domain-containing protein [Thermomicrobia bacterium]|nr:NYN domain-containing protein [Thermomicrobia bacterium]
MTREPLLIVDGYNVLHAWPTVLREAGGDFQSARVRLADRLAEYEATRGMHAILIFDGTRKPPLGPQALYAVETRFSSKGLAADHLIERLIVEIREATDAYLPITVATSDRLIHALAMREHVAVTGARAFIRELEELRVETDRYRAQTPFRVTVTEAARPAARKPRRLK